MTQKFASICKSISLSVFGGQRHANSKKQRAGFFMRPDFQNLISSRLERVTHFYGEVAAGVSRHLSEFIREFPERWTALCIQHPTCAQNSPNISHIPHNN